MSDTHYTVNGFLYKGNTTIDELVEVFSYHTIEIRDREIKTKQDFCNDSKDQYLSDYDLLTIIEALVATGKKIMAIKVVRNTTDWGLRESKDFIEQRFMIREYPPPYPTENVGE